MKRNFTFLILGLLLPISAMAQYSNWTNATDAQKQSYLSEIVSKLPSSSSYWQFTSDSLLTFQGLNNHGTYEFTLANYHNEKGGRQVFLNSMKVLYLTNKSDQQNCWMWTGDAGKLTTKSKQYIGKVSNGSEIMYPSTDYELSISEDNSVNTSDTYENIRDFDFITYSTSENYDPLLTTNKTSYAILGDATYLLGTWKNAAAKTNITNWDGTTKGVYTCSGDISQTVSVAKNHNYTVQFIVRANEGETVTLDVNGTSKSITAKGLDGAKATVNTFGRVDNLELVDNNGWMKVEVTTQPTNGKLNITLKNAVNLQFGAVRLLCDANTAGKYWTSAPTSTTVTSMDMSSLNYTYMSNSEEYRICLSSGYNKFSFFDRGDNLNSVIYANPYQVIGMTAGIYDELDHSHVCNVPVMDLTNNSSYACKLLSLTDTDGKSSWTNANSFGIGNIGKDFTALKVKYDRSFAANTVTVCLPFALTADEISAFGGNTYKFKSIVPYKATFSSVTATEANIPYIITGIINGTHLADLSNKVVVASNNLTDVSFIGTYAYLTVNGSDGAFYMFDAEDNGAFKKVRVNETADLKPFRGYIKAVASSDAAKTDALQFTIDDNTDGINALNTDNNKMNVIYGIDGRVISRNANIGNLDKGIYIVNGKKIIVKQ
jgi:hypothetical protein